MATIVFPTLSRNIPVDMELGLKSNTQVFTSDLSGQVQTTELPGTRWTISCSWPHALRDTGDSALLESFLAQLRGQANRARVRVFGRLTQRGTWAGAPLVDGAGQDGNTLILDGFTAAATVKEGDYFNVGTNGELKMITADGTASGGGALTIQFEPPLRASPADNTALVFTNPVVPQMILTDPHARWQLKPADINEFAFDLVEVFS